jgi:hypothetical protein
MPVPQCRYLVASAETLFRGLDDTHAALEPARGAKTAGWLVGHLTVTGDFARRLCGRPPIAPKEWRALFSPGTHPSADASAYPRMADLTSVFHAVYMDLCQAAPVASHEHLDAPNPYEPSRGGFPTAGDFVAYLMTGHLAHHLGQLATWRAVAGVSDTGR